jgi:nucleotide-binding universal stress UspA family protein
MSYCKILVPLDGSELAELALQHIDEVAKPGAQIHLLSVVDTLIAEEPAGAVTTLLNGVYWTASLPYEQKPLTQSAHDVHEFNLRFDYLQHASERLKEKGYEVKADVLPGDVVDTIVETARDGCDVIIMATHGRTGLRRVLLGSVAEGVLHRAPCPVLLISARRG